MDSKFLYSMVARFFFHFLNLQCHNLIAFSRMRVVGNKTMYTILKLIGFTKCKFYNIQDCISAANFICKIYYFCDLQAYNCIASHRNDRWSRTPIQRPLTRLLVVLGKDSCILIYFLSYKGTFEPSGQFSRKLVCNCATGGHSTTTLNFVTSVITVFGICKLMSWEQRKSFELSPR